MVLELHAKTIIAIYRQVHLTRLKLSEHLTLTSLIRLLLLYHLLLEHDIFDVLEFQEAILKISGFVGRRRVTRYILLSELELIRTGLAHVRILMSETC